LELEEKLNNRLDQEWRLIEGMAAEV
jgi:hypothetical protein